MATNSNVSRGEVVRLTALVLGGTVAWAVRFGFGYGLVPVACRSNSVVLHVVTLVAAAVAVAAIILSVRAWRGREDQPVRFILGVGLVLNVFFLGAILMEGSAALLVDPCLQAAT